ncbi:DUF6194 family protein [Angustibacter sp. McL0619]|uniref:DUF6194 family protein n=1 Tax=Angustibacter sp. McL0619 TaxID=3415676 RepID=UPI003CF56293
MNVAVGRRRYEELLGHTPADHAEHADEFDDAALDVLLPHPEYAEQAWVSVLNPGAATDALVTALLTRAHGDAASRLDRRRNL